MVIVPETSSVWDGCRRRKNVMFAIAVIQNPNSFRVFFFDMVSQNYRVELYVLTDYLGVNDRDHDCIVLTLFLRPLYA